MSIKVKWVPYTPHEITLEANVSYMPPENAFSFYSKDRVGSEIMSCPALALYLKNTFIIRSPYEITLDYDATTKKLNSDRYGQEFFNHNIVFKSFETSRSLLHLFPRYWFITEHKKSVHLELLPVFFGCNNYIVVPGTFDITKWIRFVELAIELPGSCKLEIKRGDPLYMVRFLTEDKETVALERGIYTDELHKASISCTTTKEFNPKLNLEKIYAMSEEYINLVKKRIFRGQK